MEGIGKGVLEKRILQGSVAHAVAVTALLYQIRCAGHVLRTAGNDDISVAAGNQLGGQIDTMKSGAAQYVNCGCRNLHRDTGVHGGLSGDVLPLSRLDNAAHIYFVNHFRLYSCPVQGLLNHDGAQVSCGYSGKRATHNADCGSAAAGQNNFSAHYFLHSARLRQVFDID